MTSHKKDNPSRRYHVSDLDTPVEHGCQKRSFSVRIQSKTTFPAVSQDVLEMGLSRVDMDVQWLLSSI